MATKQAKIKKMADVKAYEVARKPVDDQLLRRIERFLYREAFLLDERRFDEWVDLFTEDVRYWMPVRATKSRSPGMEEFATETEVAFLDETKDTLRQRVAKLGTGMAWAEEPPSRTRHVITNIEAERGDSNTELFVSSYFMVYRTRLETKQDLFVGRREDILHREPNSFRIARRKILLDMTVLMSDNISIFF